MNYVSHMYVADQLTGKNGETRLAFEFGSMAPDFASMSDTKLKSKNKYTPKNKMEENVMLGAELHHSTDEIYDHLHERVTLKTLLREDLRENLPEEMHDSIRGAADIGPDLLLDGEAITWGNTAKNFVDVMSWTKENYIELGKIALDPVKFSRGLRWRTDDDHYAIKKRNDLIDYSNPLRVAHMIYYRLESRSRLKFDESHIKTISGSLGRLQAKLREEVGGVSVARKLVDTTIEAIRN